MKPSYDNLTHPTVSAPGHLPNPALRKAAGIAAAIFLTSLVSLLVIYRIGASALRQEVTGSLVQTALTAAAFVDGDLHRTFVDPEQEHTDAYHRAVEPLLKILLARPDIRFLYTMVLKDHRPCIVLDATPTGDRDHDGVEDHSPLLQPYDAPAPALMNALTTGTPQADREPVTDQWGTYFSGYAPIHDSGGRLVGVLGVDLRLDTYAHRLASLRYAGAASVAIAFLVALLVGTGVWWLERRASRAEQDYRALFSQMVDGFALHEIICDAHGKPVDCRFLAVNPAFERLAGIKASLLIGRTVRETMPETESCSIETYGQVALTGAPIQFESCSRHTKRHYAVTAYRPAPGQCACIVSDITESKRAEEDRRKAEEQLLHVQKLEGLGLLAGGIAHDFNNLLMAIIGNADLALEELPAESPTVFGLNQIKQISLRAADLCKQMLAYSGKGKFVVGPVNLSALILDMRNLLEVSVSKKATLRYRLADNLPAVEADATQLRQVIMNLVINASEALGEKGGLISLSTGTLECDDSYLDMTYVNERQAAGLYVTLEVADTGCGMDRDTQARLFDPFFTTKFTGRGLGLAAVMGIVRGHKGAIKVYSEPDKGSTFKVLLPAAGTVAATETEAAAAPAWKGSGTILLVDDEEIVRTVATRMLKRIGFSVMTASNGQEAVDLYRQHASTLSGVIMDLTMPHMDGDVAFREMLAIRDDIPIILSSGYNAVEIDHRLSGNRLASFIQKPYQFATLVETLRTLLAPKPS